MRASSIALLVLLAAGCGSSQQEFSTSGGRAAVGVNLVSPVFFGSGTTAPANLDVIVENRSAAPIMVRSIRVESMAMAVWGIYPVQRIFRESVNPGEAKAFPLFATAVTGRARSTPNEPLSVRAVVQFESGEERYQEVFIGVVQSNR